MIGKRTYSLAFILITSLFLLWGMANNMNDTLLAAFKRIMSMSDLQTSLVQLAFYGSYFCFALPAALFVRKFSYKSGIILGLLLYAAGTMLFLPAGQIASYGFFLFAIYVMAGGCSILETTANPLIMALGSPETATRRLNIAQSFNPLGAIIGIFLSRCFILGQLRDVDAAERSAMSAPELSSLQSQELSAISATYFAIGLVLMALVILIALVRMPSDRDGSTIAGSIGSTIQNLRHNRHYCFGVFAQFFYVGAQTCVWSFTIRLVMSQLGMREAQASGYFLAAIVLFTVFRFIFTYLMKYFRPARLLMFAVLGAVAATVLTIFGKGMLAVGGLVSISAFMSLMFPTIYGLSLHGISAGEAKIASSGLIMSIVGGALITPVQGLISDLFGISVSFFVPLVCFIVICIYSLYESK